MDSATIAAPGKSGPVYTGTPAQQEFAAKAYDLMRRQGTMYGADSPIVVTLDRLAQGLARHYAKLPAEDLRRQLDAALQANQEIFTRKETGGTVAYEITRSGRRYTAFDESRHMYRHRLNGDARDVSEQESRTLTEGWIALAQARGAESFTIFQEPAAEAAVAGRWQGPAEIAAFVAPTQPVTPDAPVNEPYLPLLPPTPPMMAPMMAPLPPAGPVYADLGVPAFPAPSAPPTVPQDIFFPPFAEPTPAPPETPFAGAPPVVDEAPPVVAPPAPVAAAPAPVPVAPAPPPRVPVPPAVLRPVRFVLPTPEGEATLDLSGSLDDIMAAHGPQLEALLGQTLREDFRFAAFGDEWYPEEHVERFSKGDFRRIREYLIETQEALSDRAFMNDVLGRRENDPDYERLRFSLNYRMLREKKDFEFVGVPADRLWVVVGASPVSVPKRKPSELGQDFRYLEDPAVRPFEPALPTPATRIEHALTYYEYENGLLPYDQVARALLPRPMLADQRAALLRIEVPLLFQNFPVELRYPLGNRGGYLVGFDAFFQENLVPGATFTLETTDQENVLILRFERTAAQEESLLQYDERRNRFVFRPTTFYAGATPDWLLSEKRFPRLDGLKRLDDAERKKTENLVIHAFELVGEELDGRTLALVSDLLPVVNLERPVSEGALRAILEGGHHAGFEADPATPGAFFYDATKK